MKIKAKFKHSRKGVVFQRDEEITNLSKAEQEEAVLNKLAYYDKPKVEITNKDSEDVETLEEAPSMANTKKEIIEYLNDPTIDFDTSMTKAELLELC